MRFRHSFLLGCLALASGRAAARRRVPTRQPSSSSPSPASAPNEPDYVLRVYHMNDIHVHLDQFNAQGSDCGAGEACFGGSARLKQYLLDHRPRDRPSMLLNAGDETTGTLYYRAHGHEKIAEALNELNVTAMCLGNHEFDGGIDGLHAFVDMLGFPVLSANVHLPPPSNGRPSRVGRYRVFPEYGVAVVGVTTEDTALESKAGHAARFDDVIRSVQAAVDEIYATTDIKRIILLSHIGYDVDQKLAAQTTGLYYIVGGHTDSLLGSMAGAEGRYPTVVRNKDWENVFIVQAFHWGFYLGVNDVTFAPDGRVRTVVGKPVLMEADRRQDAELQARVEAWRESFTDWAREAIGLNEVANDFKNPNCKDFPCFAGAFAADAIYAEYHGQHPGDGTAFGIVNGGGCRTSLPLGNVTNGQLYMAFPFENNVTHLAMPGQAVWDTFNKVLHGLEGRDRRNGTLFHTSSNVRVEWNYQAADKAQRLVSVTVNGRALDRAATYRLVTTDFLAYGGDGYWLNSGFKPVDTPRTVEETLRDYLASNPQVSYRNMDRMIEVSGLRQPPRRDPSQRLWTPRRDPSDWDPDKPPAL